MISGSTKRDSRTPFFCRSGVSVPPVRTFGASGPSMFMRSSSAFWNARSRDWSSSMMLISMRPICGIFLPFISATMRASSGSVPAWKSQTKPR